MSLNFPTKKKLPEKKINKANLGMNLEKLLNETNEYYLNNDLAVIHKKPTPVQIVSVDFPARNKAVIKEAYYKTPSTTDYNGVYKGLYIDFEAKENNNTTSFPLANVHEHQVNHLKQICKHGGIGFFIVNFSVYNQHFLLPFSVLNKYWTIAKEGGRKSIPYSAFLEEAHLIKEGFRPRLDYLKVLNEKIL